MCVRLSKFSPLMGQVTLCYEIFRFQFQQSVHATDYWILKWLGIWRTTLSSNSSELVLSRASPSQTPHKNVVSSCRLVVLSFTSTNGIAYGRRQPGMPANGDSAKKSEEIRA